MRACRPHDVSMFAARMYSRHLDWASGCKSRSLLGQFWPPRLAKEEEGAPLCERHKEALCQYALIQLLLLFLRPFLVRKAIKNSRARQIDKNKMQGLLLIRH